MYNELDFSFEENTFYSQEIYIDFYVFSESIIFKI